MLFKINNMSTYAYRKRKRRLAWKMSEILRLDSLKIVVIANNFVPMPSYLKLRKNVELFRVLH